MSGEIDFEADASPKGSSTDLEQLVALGERLVADEAQLAHLEAQVAARKKALAELREQLIPSRMQELRLTSFGLASGRMLAIEDFWAVSLSDGPKGSEHKANAVAFLRSTGNESLIKVHVGVDFKAGKEAEAKALAELIRASGLPAKETMDVNTGSFKALLKELDGEGTLVEMQLDLTTVGAFKGKRAVVK